MIRKNDSIETITTQWEGQPIRMILSHADAVQKLAHDGYHPPRIPDGCNTVIWYYQDPSGRQCIVVNQSGFAREVGDDEREVNGCWVAILEAAKMDLVDGRSLLSRLYYHLAQDDTP
jgi:hypothetical protein